MEAEKYLDRTLAKYSQMYDIYPSYSFGERTYPAYAYFSQHGEKYVLSKKAQLWQVKGFEHVLFLKTDKFTTEDAKEAHRLMEEEMAPIMVCKGEKYPEKDHMVSNLTVVYLSEKAPDEDALKSISKFHFDKGYLFSFRGHADGRLVCCDMENEKIYTNFAGRILKESFVSTFKEVKAGLKGFEELNSEEASTESSDEN